MVPYGKELTKRLKTSFATLELIFLGKHFLFYLHTYTDRARTEMNEELATWYKASNGYRYKVSTERSSYSDAMKKCEKHGAKLAHVAIRNKAFQP